MKICVFGAGAIGGLVGARLAAKGEVEVSLVARGPHLAAMRRDGLTLKEAGRETMVRVAATDRPAYRVPFPSRISPEARRRARASSSFSSASGRTQRRCARSSLGRTQ